jgi:hypothetical protein
MGRLLMKKILILLLGCILGSSIQADQQYEGSTGDNFYSGNLADGAPASSQPFIQKIPQKKTKQSTEFFDDATVPSFTGGFEDQVSKAPVKYYIFPMQIENDQHATFVGTVEGSSKEVTLKDEEFIKTTVEDQTPLINGTLTLYVGKQKAEKLEFEGNLMKITEYPQDLLPTQQMCEAEECCLKINLSKSTPGMSHTFDVNLSNGVCPMEEAHPKEYIRKAREIDK